MKFIKVFLFVLTVIILPVSLSAQTVSGKLIDENSQPLPYANVVLLSLPDSAFVSGATSDDKGNFILKDLSARSYLLQVSYIGYQPQSILLENLDRKINLGDIRLVQDAVSLQGVTVTGSNVMEKIDRQIVIPSSRQIKAATSGYELLSHMQLPGLKVNSIERSISTVSGGSVQLRINDIEASTAQVQALRPDEVLRVEYIDNPDMRYANTDVEAVINYVVKRRESGIAGGFNLTNAVTTGFGNDNVYIKANHKLSEFGFNYYVSYRDYNDRFVNEDQTFSLPDGNRDRYLKGITTPFNYADHYLELNYNLTKPEKYVFNASFTDNLFRSPHNDYGQIIQEEGKNDIYSFTKKINNSNSPSLDLYGKVLLPKDQELVLNMVGTYISSDYERNYNESLTEGGTPYSEYIYSTDGKRYSLIGEGIYKKNFKNVALSGGLKYTLAYTNNKYMGDVNQTDEMHSSDLYGYVQVNGKWKKLSYLLGVGLSRQSYDESGKGYSFYMFRPSASLSYKPFEGATLKYVFSSTPNVPSLSSLSDIRQQLTDIEVNRGNPNLKPYRSYSNTLQLSWGNKWVDLQLKGGYYFSKNPIMEEVNMVLQPDGSYIFEYGVDNQNRFSRLNGQLYANVNIIPDMLSLSLYGGVNRYESKGNSYTHNFNAWYGGGNLSFTYKKFSANAVVSSRYNTLYGETISYGEKNCMFQCLYKIKNFNVGAGMLFPFQPKGWSGGTKLLSKEVRKETWSFIKDNGNMFLLSLSWDFSVGKKHNAEGKITNNVDRETGIAM